jgi:hypothetical protein
MLWFLAEDSVKTFASICYTDVVQQYNAGDFLAHSGTPLPNPAAAKAQVVGY